MILFFVGVGLGNSSTNDYYMFFLTEINISLMKYDGATSHWTTISQLPSSANKNGTLLMIFDVDYFWCHLNDILLVWGDSGDVVLDTVNIYHWGKMMHITIIYEYTMIMQEKCEKSTTKDRLNFQSKI